MKLWKHQTQFDPNEVNWKSLTVAILASFFFTLYCETVVWNSRPSECDRMAIGKKLSAKKIAHVNLARSPPTTSTAKNIHNDPKLPPNAHTLSLIFERHQLAYLHVNVSHRLYQLISIFFFFLSPLSSISHSICTPSFFRSSSFLPPPSPSSLTHPQLLPSGMYLARRLETYHPPSFPPPPPPTLLITQWITRFWGGWPPLRKQVSNEYRPP